MKEKWQIFSNYINGEKLYRVGRRENPAEPLHSGNVEYFGGYTTNRTEAEKNRKQIERERQITQKPTAGGISPAERIK